MIKNHTTILLVLSFTEFPFLGICVIIYISTREGSLPSERVFRTFFCLENELRNVFSEIFAEFTLRKLRKTRSELLNQGQNWKIGGWKRVVGGGKRIFPFLVELVDRFVKQFFILCFVERFLSPCFYLFYVFKILFPIIL
jgi:hypothetical protein